jgi:hypothetical protein
MLKGLPAIYLDYSIIILKTKELWVIPLLLWFLNPSLPLLRSGFVEVQY